MARNAHIFVKLESKREQKFRKAIKAKGGLALKLTTPGFTGIPDRLVLIPSGKIFFAEIKDGKNPTSARQKIVIALLRTLGFDVWIIRTDTDLEAFIQDL